MKRLLQLFILMLGLAVLLAGGLYGLRETLLGPRLLAALNTELGPALGIELTAERIGGNYFNHLELHQLRSRPLAGDPEAAALELRLTRVRLDYALPALRHGLAPFLATLRIHLQDGELDLNLAALPDRRMDKPPGDPAGLKLPPLPHIEAERLDLRLRHDRLALRAAALAFTLQPDFEPLSGRPAAFRLDLHSERLRLDHPRLRPISAPLQAGLRLDPQTVMIETLRLDELLTVETARLAYRPAQPCWQLELVMEVLGGRLALQGTDSPTGQQARFQLQEFDLERLAALAAPRPDQSPWPELHGKLDLEGELILPAGEPPSNLDGRLALHLRQAGLGGYQLDDLQLLARLGGGVATLDQLAARLGDNRLIINGLSLRLAELTATDPARLAAAVLIESFNGELTDLPALAAVFGQPLPPAAAEIPAHRLTFAGALTDGVLTLAQVELVSGPDRFRAAATLTGDSGRERLQFQLELAAIDGRWQSLALQASGDFRLSGDYQGDLRLNDLRLSAKGLELGLTAPARLRIEAGRFSLTDLKLAGPTAAIELRGSYDRRHPGAELDLLATLTSENLAWLAPLVDGVRRTEGRLELELRLSGPAADPQMEGGLMLTGGAIRFTGDSPLLRELEVRARFDRNHLRLERLEGRLGGAPFTVSGDVIPAQERPWDPDRWQFDVQMSGRDILFYRTEGVRVRGDGRLRISGPLAGLRVAGEIVITDGRYTRNVDFFEIFRGTGTPRRQAGLELFSFTTPPWRDITFDLRLRTATSFLVANNMARGGLRPVLTLGGTGELPVVTGEIYLDPTRISLPASRLTVESGLIHFPAADPDRPTFDLTATTRLAGYDITLVLQGSADEPVLTLSSVPPLADDELLLLVLTGRPPTLIGDAAQRRAGMNVAVYLGRNLLARLLRGDAAEADETILERFDLELGRGITKSGQETIEASFLLAEDVVRSGDRLFITSERDLYDDFNVGLKIVFRLR